MASAATDKIVFWDILPAPGGCESRGSLLLLRTAACVPILVRNVAVAVGHAGHGSGVMLGPLPCVIRQMSDNTFLYLASQSRTSQGLQQ